MTHHRRSFHMTCRYCRTGKTSDNCCGCGRKGRKNGESGTVGSYCGTGGSGGGAGNKGNGLFHIIQIDRGTSSVLYVCSSCLYDCFLGFLHFLLCRFLHFLFYTWVLNW